MNLVAPFFLVPYFIINNPVVLSMSQPFGEAILALVALFLAWAAFLFFCQGYFLAKTSPVEQIGFLAVTVLGVIYGFYGNRMALAVAVILFIILSVVQWRKRSAMLSLAES